MQLKTYHAGSMPEVMRRVREELGDEAVIVSTIEGDDGHVRVTAALERPDPPPFTASPDAASDAERGESAGVADRIAAMLDYHGVPGGLSDRLLRRAAAAGADDAGLALAAALDETFRFAPIPVRGVARPLIFVGPPGAGKTLTTAKLAARLVMGGLAATVVDADIARAAAADQLAAFSAILGTRLESASTPDELAGAVARGGVGDAVLIDSFAVNPFDRAEMARLGAFVAAADAEPILVLAAGLDPPEAAEIAEAFAALGAGRMIATRIDQTRRLGSVLAAAFAGVLVVADAGVTPHVAHGLAPLNPVSLARLLCRDPESDATGLFPAPGAEADAAPDVPSPVPPPLKEVSR